MKLETRKSRLSTVKYAFSGTPANVSYTVPEVQFPRKQGNGVCGLFSKHLAPGLPYMQKESGVLVYFLCLCWHADFPAATQTRPIKASQFICPRKAFMAAGA
jgi:hypothetical protein